MWRIDQWGGINGLTRDDDYIYNVKYVPCKNINYLPPSLFLDFPSNLSEDI